MGGGTANVEKMLGEPHKAILSMVGPIFIALLIGQINTFVDSVWCSSLGVNALASISLVSSLYFVIIGVGNGIGVGVNVAISRRIGAGDKEGAEKCAGQTFFLMILVSLPIIPFMILIKDPVIVLIGGSSIMSEAGDYLMPMFLLCTFAILNGVISGMLRGEGAARLSTVINVVSAFVNMVLDPILIFVAGMGLQGASTATMLSSVFAVSMGIFVYHRKITYLGLHYSRFERSILADVFYVGIPQMVEMNVMSFMNLILVTFVVKCGGTDGLSTYGTPWRFISLIMVPANALAAALVPVCSSAIGQKDRERLKSGYYFTVKAALAFSLILSVVMFVFAGPAMNAFTYSDNMSGYHDEMVHAIRIYVWMLPCYGLIFVGSSMLSALRKSNYSLMSAFLRNVMLCIIYYVASFHTMDWIYWGLTLGEIVGGVFMMSLAQWQFGKRYSAMAPGIS